MSVFSAITRIKSGKRHCRAKKQGGRSGAQAARKHSRYHLLIVLLLQDMVCAR